MTSSDRPGEPAALPEQPGALAVVVVNYGSSGLLRRNLASASLDAPVIVVDNFSTDEERAAVGALAAEQGWYLVTLPGNPGFGTAVNAGVAAAGELGCVTYLLLNPDAVVTPEVVAALRAHSLREPDALLSPLVTDSEGRTVFGGSRLHLRDGRLAGGPPGAGRGTTVEWLTGACLVIHREMFDRTGGFSEEYFLYWEDVDLSYRALRAGGRVLVRTDLVAVHDEGGTQGERQGRAKSDLYYSYNCRNRLLFAARNLGRRDLLRWIVRTPAMSWEILLRGGRRQLLHSPRPLMSAVRGTLAGLGIALSALVRARPARRSGRSVLVAHPGTELYGSDRVLLESVEALVTAGPVVVAVPQEGPLVEELRRRGARVEVVAMPVLRKAALRPRGAGRLFLDAVRGLAPAIRLIRSAGAGGVYVSTLTLPSWILLARLLGRRVVCHVHEAERSAPRVVRRAMALGPRMAHAVVVNSRFSLGVLVDVAPGIADRSDVIYNGVRGPGAVVPPRMSLDGPVRLLYVGRISPRKGPQVAVAALRELTERGVDARLALLGSVFTGYEWFEAELRGAVAAAGLDDRVDFLGFRPDIWPAMAAADIVLIPSVLDEPFGNTAVEAVLAARPLVVSTTSGLQEAAAGYDSAQAVDPEHPALWADAVERVVAEWPRLRAAAVDDAAEAHRRHDPALYQSRVAAVVSGSAEPVGGSW